MPSEREQIDKIVGDVTAAFRADLRGITDKPLVCLISGKPVEPWALEAMERARSKPLSACVSVYHNMCGRRTTSEPCGCQDCQKIADLVRDHLTTERIDK